MLPYTGKNKFRMSRALTYVRSAIGGEGRAWPDVVNGYHLRNNSNYPVLIDNPKTFLIMKVVEPTMLVKLKANNSLGVELFGEDSPQKVHLPADQQSFKYEFKEWQSPEPAWEMKDTSSDSSGTKQESSYHSSWIISGTPQERLLSSGVHTPPTPQPKFRLTSDPTLVGCDEDSDINASASPDSSQTMEMIVVD